MQMRALTAGDPERMGVARISLGPELSYAATEAIRTLAGELFACE